jgi:hypothetical protein
MARDATTRKSNQRQRFIRRWTIRLGCGLLSLGSFAGSASLAEESRAGFGGEGRPAPHFRGLGDGLFAHLTRLSERLESQGGKVAFFSRGCDKATDEVCDLPDIPGLSRRAVLVDDRLHGDDPSPDASGSPFQDELSDRAESDFEGSTAKLPPQPRPLPIDHRPTTERIQEALPEVKETPVSKPGNPFLDEARFVPLPPNAPRSIARQQVFVVQPPFRPSIAESTPSTAGEVAADGSSRRSQVVGAGAVQADSQPAAFVR